MQTSNKQSGARDVERVFRPSGALLQAGTTLGRAIEEYAVSRTDVNATTVDLLVRLSLSPERQLRGVDLCRQLLKSPGYVSRLLDKAEADGLVTREPDPDDRRAQLIVLTASGDAVLETFVPNAIDVLVQTVYTALDDNEIEMLIDLLTRITRTTEAFLET
jgi:DNA-binding MarR family transcriptional regulator